MSYFTPGVTRSTKNPLAKSQFQLALELLIRNSFAEPTMFRVESETHKFRLDAAPEVWAQVHGELPEVCEVYFNNKYLCDIPASKRPEEALALIEFSLLQKLAK